MAIKNYLAKIESKGLEFFYVVSYDPSSTSPIEYALLDQARSKLVEQKHEEAEFKEIPADDYERFRQKHGFGQQGNKADQLSYLFK